MTSGALWLTTAKVFAFGLSVALPLLLVRRLSKEEFGLYKQAFLVVGTAVAVLPLGFVMSAFYFLPREPERQREVVLNILLFNTAVGGLAFVALAAYPNLLEIIFHSAELVRLGPLIGLVMLLWIVSGSIEVIPLALRETRLAASFIVFGQLLRTALLVGAALAFASVKSLVVAAAVYAGLQTVILLIYLNLRFPGYWRAFDASMLRAQVGYAVPLGMSAVLWTLQHDLHNYFVSNQFGPAAFAIYSVGCFELPLVQILSESVASVMIPRINVLHKENNTREIILLTSRVMRKLAAVFFPIYVFLMVVGREFLDVLFTAAYRSSWPILAINLTLIPVSVWVFDPIARAYANRRFFFLRVKLLMFALVGVVLWFRTAQLGLIGVIAVVVAASIVERAICVLRLGRDLGVTRTDVALIRDVGKLGVASIGAGIAAFVVRLVSLPKGAAAVLVAAGFAFAITYFALVWALRILTSEDRELLLHPRALVTAKSTFYNGGR